MIPVIISGGSGERLWPISRKAFPKPFCSFFDESLMIKTLRRVCPLGPPLVLTTKNLRTLTEQCLQQCQMSLDSAIYEPFGRNTAPAIARLCHQLKLRSLENEVVGIFPADQLIEKEDELIRLAHRAEELARGNNVVTLGIPPSYPATGFGYIEVGPHNQVLCFHEKPDLSVAERYVRCENFLWNAGMFFFRVEGMIQNFQELMPQLWKQMEMTLPNNSNMDDIYNLISPKSFDHGIMEVLSQRLCLLADIGWSDLGSWEQVFSTKEPLKTQSQNIEVNAKNNRSLSLAPKTIGFLGVENLTVIDTPDALLICDTNTPSNMKELLQQVKKLSPQSTEYHTWDTRPWGSYETLLQNNSAVVKKIWVHPRAKLSYQSHDFREEHWVVIQGQGEVTIDDKVYPVKEGDYIHIPIQTKHRMANTGDGPLGFIEVQRGSQLLESDIHRYQDDFGR